MPMCQDIACRKVVKMPGFCLRCASESKERSMQQDQMENLWIIKNQMESEIKELLSQMK